MILDGKNLVLGRVATFVARKVLEGETVDLINSESMVISGDKQAIFRKYKERMEKGDAYHGVFLPKMPDRFVKRTIRGMIPYKKERGSNAYKRIKCHIGVPNHLRDKETKTLENANMKKFKTLKFIYVKDLCAFLGGKIQQ